MTKEQDQYNRGGLIAFVFSMVFSLGFFFYISFLHPGVDLKEVPELSADPSLPPQADSAGPKKVDVSQVTEPWVFSEDMVAHGRAVYQTHCMVCHGPQGKGDGPAGASLIPKPRNLVAGGWGYGGTSAQLYATLKNGIRGTSMVSFAHLPKVDRWAMVHYIRSITKDRPKENAEELANFAKTAK